MKTKLLLVPILLFAGMAWGQEQKSFKERNKIPLDSLKYALKDKKKSNFIILNKNVIYDNTGKIISTQKDTIYKPEEKKISALTDVELEKIGLIKAPILANLQVVEKKIIIHPWNFDGKEKDKANSFFDKNEAYIVMKDRVNYSFPYSSYQLGIVTLPIKWYMDSKLGNVETSINAMINVGYKWGKSRFVKFPHEEKARTYKSAFSINILAGISKIELNKVNTDNKIEEANIATISLGASFGIHYGDFTFMPVLGFDLPTAHQKDWNFNGTPWLGLGIGYNFLKFN